MKKKKVAHAGGRKVVRGKMQMEAAGGQRQNRKHKSQFKVGPITQQALDTLAQRTADAEAQSAQSPATSLVTPPSGSMPGMGAGEE